MLAATLLRAAPLWNLRVNGHVELVTRDSYFHLRNSVLALRGALATPDLDAWQHVPRGLPASRPPLLDLCTALLARPWCGSAGDFHCVADVGSAVMVLLVLVGFGFTGWAAARRAGRIAGVATVAILALSPAHHTYTAAGQLDHHVLEALLPFAALELLLCARAAPRPSGRLGAATGAALCWAALVAGVPSAPLGIAMGVGAFALVIALDEDDAARRRASELGALACALAATLCIPLAALSLRGARGETVSFTVSWLHPGWLATSAAALLATGRARRGAKYGAARSLAAGVGVAAVLLAGWPGARAALTSGAGFVASAGPYSVVREAASALRNGVFESLSDFSWLALGTPLLAARAWARRREPGGADLVAWSAVMIAGLGLALVQVRFAVLLALPLSLVAGVSVTREIERLRDGRRLVLAIGTAAAVLPGATHLTLRTQALRANQSTWQAYDWLREHTPSPGDAWQAGVRPSWSVMAPWPLGHELVVRAERANVASPLHVPGELDGMNRSLRFWLAEPDEAEQILVESEARYVLAAPLAFAATAAYAEALGRDASAYVTRDTRGQPADVTAAGAATAAFALIREDGSAREARSAWAFLRLVHSQDRGRAKVFERVEGARIVGSATPGSRIALEVRREVAGQRSSWTAECHADAAGRFMLRSPYATDGGSSGTVRVIGARLTVDGVTRELVISERAVVAGDEVR